MFTVALSARQFNSCLPRREEKRMFTVLYLQKTFVHFDM